MKSVPLLKAGQSTGIRHMAGWRWTEQEEFHSYFRRCEDRTNKLLKEKMELWAAGNAVNEKWKEKHHLYTNYRTFAAKKWFARKSA